MDPDHLREVEDMIVQGWREIKAADPRSDLAVLQVVEPVNASEFVPIKFGNAEKLKKGQIVIALGNPYALARDGQVSASWGIVANIARKDGPVPDAPNCRFVGPHTVVKPVTGLAAAKVVAGTFNIFMV